MFHFKWVTKKGLPLRADLLYVIYTQYNHSLPFSKITVMYMVHVDKNHFILFSVAKVFFFFKNEKRLKNCTKQCFWKTQKRVEGGREKVEGKREKVKGGR